MNDTTDCLHCIDGMAPSTSDLFGHCFSVCHACRPCCPCCAGHGIYPAWTRDMAEFAALYNNAGFAPVLCHTCGGVLDVAPLDEENHP